MIQGTKVGNYSIRWAMVGGGRGSQIGYIHRSAALRDNNFVLVAGAFDIDPARGMAFGQELGVAKERCYPDYHTMFREEAKRPDKIQAVSIATPNGTHYAIAKAALLAGLHIVCEKPLTFRREEADELVALAEEKGLVCGMTFGYAGHQLIWQARRMIQEGALGKIRMIRMCFAHGGNCTAVEKDNPSQKWRLDTRSAGPSFVISDAGIHALFLALAMVEGLQIEAVLCSNQNFVEGRALEDNSEVLIKFNDGMRGVLWSSAVNAGSTHELRIRIIGEKASLEWWDEDPNVIRYEEVGKPKCLYGRGSSYLAPEAVAEDRIGGGHAEGLFDAWANIYRRFAIAMHEKLDGMPLPEGDFWYPDIYAGRTCVRFVEACVKSAQEGDVWKQF